MKNQSHFQIRRDTAANWAAANPVLRSGEPGFVTDTGELKMGNGIAAFNDLPALGTGAGEGGAAPAEETANNYSQYQTQSYRIPYVEGEEADQYVISNGLTYEDLCNMSDNNKNVLYLQGPSFNTALEPFRIGIANSAALNEVSLTTTPTSYPVLCLFNEAFNTIDKAIESNISTHGEATSDITCYITKETFPAITEFTVNSPT